MMMNGILCRQRVFALAGTLAALLPAGTAWSQTAPPFAQLLQQANAAPRVTALNADVARAQGLAEQARARPNPTVNVYAENFAGDLTRNARNQEQITGQLDIPIELGGKRSSRIAASEAAILAARARGIDGRLLYATELARAYAGAEIAAQRIERAADRARRG